MAAAVTQFRYRIEGMDCAGCAATIEGALKRMPGIRAAQINFGAELLSLEADGVAPDLIEKKVRDLGFVPRPAGRAAAPARREDGCGHDHGHDHGPADDHGHPHDHAHEIPPGTAWWRTGKARLTLASGLALAGAAAVGWIEPAATPWAFGLAALVGMVPVARQALRLALNGAPFSIETLMVIAAAGAIAIGAAEEAAVVVFLFALGEMLEGVAAGRARAGIRGLVSLLPRTALLLEAGRQREVPADTLKPGDRVLVRPGDRVPADGAVIDGESAVDEAPITGESVPVAKAAGSSVFAGSINGAGALRVRVERAAADNTIARIIHMVEEAQGRKAPLARFIDRFSAWYTPAALVMALLIALVPPLAFGGVWQEWIYRALAILLIACPCALVISTPAAIAAGLAAGARRGLLIKGGAALETLGRVVAVAFDKTGTLTAGRPQVTDIVPVPGESEAGVLALAAAIEAGSSHPLGNAIRAKAEARDLPIVPAEEASAIPGRAVQARVGGVLGMVASVRHAASLGPLPLALGKRAAALEEEGKTVVVVLAAGRALGLIALRDEPRPDAAAGIAALTRLGIRTTILTGDNRRTAAAIGAALGVEAQAELLPDAKLAAIDAMRRDGPVAMVGDGINDAPALAAASIGVAMGGGTDVALETADAAVLRDRVLGVADLVMLSRDTLSNIRQNIAIALGLKALFLATTLLGVTSLWMAILADTGATVLVTANAIRLLRWRGEG